MTKPKTFIIAEAGVNHNGSLEMAKQLVEAAAEAGADAVKFQTFKAERLVTASTPKANYQVRTTGSEESQLEMIRALELSEQDHIALINCCREQGIEFLSTPFDLESVALLASTFDLRLLKIPSGEITNAPLLLACARSGKPVVLSTGMSTLGEVEDALGVLAFGYLNANGVPSSTVAFRSAYALSEGHMRLAEKVTLLHCTTEYPAPPEEINLRAMDTLAAAFGLPVGYSDHTEGIIVPVAAVARGAVIIEKHFTLDRALPGPDHKASLEPLELKEMVNAIRIVEKTLGSGRKYPTTSEWNNISVARKSLVASTSITAGDVFSAENIVAKRPGNGLSPRQYWELLGRKARKDFTVDEMIEL